MTSHPSSGRAQAILDASRRGDYAPASGNFAADIVMGNGSGAAAVSGHAEVAPAWIMAMEAFVIAATVTALVVLRRQPRMQGA
jgi:hypothetical protein